VCVITYIQLQVFKAAISLIK